ncbi:MAG: hypothetical protein IT559_04280 [Alphaproteobacteria bacterium]|nr:hypothetical protein [Alphaproteobacteria bacterium]
MNKKLWYILLAFVLFVGVFSGVLAYMSAKRQEQAGKQYVAEQKAQNAEIKADFEVFLNGFLADVEKNAFAYKQRRKVLTGLIKPENMKMPEYIEENASLAESTILALHLQMNEILEAFAKADHEIETLLPGLPEGERIAARQKWEQVRTNSQDQFTGYFASERDILAAYKKLLHFYAEKKESISIDSESNAVYLLKPEDQKEALALQKDIKDLEAAQIEFMQQAPQN